MASDYDMIHLENIRKYGEETQHLAFLSRLYSDRTHFVYELLQNAEDAEASSVGITLYKDRLEVLHNGKPFDEKDVLGICGVGEGTKPEDLTKIGKFGIGFKSVYAYTKAPEIHCGDEHFGIEHYVRPYAIDRVDIPEPWTTRFVFPFHLPSPSDAAPLDKIAARLKSLNVRTLLFLRSISEITWRIDTEESGIYIRVTEYRDAARIVNVIGQADDGNDVEETWLVFEKAVDAPDGTEVKPVEVAFLLDPEPKEGRSREIVATQESPLFVFFATEKDTNLGFLVQGPYRTTPARDNIPRDDPWNAFLLEETAEHVISVLQCLKKMGLLTVPVLETLPIEDEDFPPKSLFRPVYERVAKALMEETLLPALGSRFIRGCDAIIGRGEDIRNLLSSDQLRALYKDVLGEDDVQNLEWLSELITQERTPELLHYLMNELHIEEVTPESFARRVTDSFFSEQSDEWLARLYRFLLRQEALWRKAADRRADGPIRHKKFVRLDDGRQVGPFSEDGTVAVYLPHQGARQLPTIKPELVRDSEVAEFFARLGIQEPDIIAEVLEHVLPLYEPDEMDVSEEDHKEHINLIVKALHVDSIERRQTLITSLKDSYVLFGRNAATNEEARVLPQELYLGSGELSVFLEGNPDAWVLDERYSDDQIDALRRLGISSDLRIQMRLGDRKGHVTVYQSHGLHKRGLDGFDPECTVDHLEYAVQSPTLERSLFIWKNIAIPLQRQIRGTVERATRQTFENSEPEPTVSALGELLRSNSWLPDVTGAFHEPSELSLADLPETFDRDESLAGHLGMKGSELVVLAKRSGLDVADLDMLRELKGMPEQFKKLKEMIGKNKRKPSFPERPSTNTERRTQRAKRDAKDGPRKEYEDRSRSVRTSQATGDKDTYLKESYTNDDGELVCQMCEHEMPFRRRDGQYYFESVQLFDDLAGEHAAAHLAFCPLCAAKYKEFVKRDSENATVVRAGISSSEQLAVHVGLGHDVGSIRFVEKHLLDVQGVLEEETDRSSVR